MARKKNEIEYEDIKFYIPGTPFTNSFPITLVIGASREDWIYLSFYLEDRGAKELASQTMKICYDKKFMGPFSGDKRKKVDGPADHRKKFATAALIYVSYWASKPEIKWPNEFKKIINMCPRENILDKRCASIKFLPRSIVYYLCTSDEKLLKEQPKFILENEAQKQDVFEVQYFDNQKYYLKFASKLFKKGRRFLTIGQIYQCLPEPSTVNIKAPLKSFRKRKT